jgi:hypothetical protein
MPALKQASVLKKCLIVGGVAGELTLSGYSLIAGLARALQRRAGSIC